MKTRTRELIAVGLIVKVFGIKGDVIVKPLTPDPGRFRKLRTVRLSRLPQAEGLEALPDSPRTVERASIDARGVRLKLSGIGDRTDAGRIVGCYLCVEETEAIPLHRGEFFVHDIIGLTVIDQGGRAIGPVTDVMRLPAHDVYIVSHEGREVMIPAVREFIKTIDLDARAMHVVLINGMLEG